ncbi:putative BPI/LBP family protein At1g04970 isoform X3 [Euphorbia lathyris]|uniref:putative BPI/LBP family protein At1g04970 isoform X3 n=2 Tax=Euphorbia lathyris TaxID=212925 RepID=UPI0033133FCE
MDVSKKALEFLRMNPVGKRSGSLTSWQTDMLFQLVQFEGDVDMHLSRILITQIQVYSSGCNKSGVTAGLQLIAWGEVCNLTVDFHLPFYHRLADNGCAAIKVVGVQLGNRLDLEKHNGILKLSLVDLDFNYSDISVEVNEEGSWLFRRMIHSFQRHIGVSVQKAVSKKIREQILKLDSFLQDVPKEIPIDEISSLNVTLLKGNSSYIFDINGLFLSRNRSAVPLVSSNFRNSQPSVLCTQESKSIGISIHEDVLNSASALYYDAEFMRWIVDKLPDDSLLKTDIVPEVKKLYPNDDMKLNISLSCPPMIRISEDKIDASVNAELIINVLKAEELVGVACFSLKIEGSGSVEIIEDEYPGMLRVGGSMKLKDLSVSMEWSNIGNLPLHVIESVVETVVLPYANAQLRQGFVMPGIHGFLLWKAQIILSNSRITLCGDLAYVEPQ